MKNTRFSVVIPVLIAGLAVYLPACKTRSAGGSSPGGDGGSIRGVASVLSASGPTGALIANDCFSITASGGTEPYSYSMLSGSGSVDTSTGLYTAPVSATDAQVQVADSAGATATVSISTNSKQRFVYAPGNGSDNVSVFRLNPCTGALTEVAGSPFATGSSPYKLAIHPSGQFAYVTNSLSFTISAFQINSSTGALQSIAGSPFAAGSGGAGYPWKLAFDPAGHYLYVDGAVPASIMGYSVNSSTGALSPLGASPFNAAAFPVGIAIDPTGQFLYSAHYFGNQVSAFRLDSNGNLSSVGNYAAGATLEEVTIAAGSFVYAASSGSGQVLGYRINSSTGELSALSGTSYAPSNCQNLVNVLSNNDGTFLYASCVANGGLRVFRVNETSGNLTEVSGSAVTVPNSGAPWGTALEPSGKFLFVADNTGFVHSYRVDASTGKLTFASSVAAGSTPYYVTVTGD